MPMYQYNDGKGTIMKTPQEITQALAPQLNALGEAHGKLGERIFEMFEDGSFTLEETMLATALAGAMLEMLMEDPVEVGTMLMGKVLHNEREAQAFARELADMPEAA